MIFGKKMKSLTFEFTCHFTQYIYTFRPVPTVNSLHLRPFDLTGWISSPKVIRSCLTMARPYVRVPMDSQSPKSCFGGLDLKTYFRELNCLIFCFVWQYIRFVLYGLTLVIKVHLHLWSNSLSLLCFRYRYKGSNVFNGRRSTYSNQGSVYQRTVYLYRLV